MNGKMHTEEQCKTKIKGLQTLLKRISEADDVSTQKYLAESANEMCKELLREFD
jgi:hypothetical protein